MDNLNKPAFISTGKSNVDGLDVKRLMVVYKTRGCSYGKCTMCGFSSNSSSEISDENIENQHDNVLKILKDGKYAQFDMLISGNFFNDEEFSSKLREIMLKPLSKIKEVKRVLLESRREFITTEKLKEAKSFLRDDQILEVGFGYESYNEKIRNEILNKNVPERYLDESFVICKESNISLFVYVLIKPQNLTEKEGIDDSVETAVHVLSLADKYKVNTRIGFEPVFVAKGTVVEKMFNEGKYKPPKPESVLEVLLRSSEKLGEKNVKGKLFVGLCDENLSDGHNSFGNGRNEIACAIRNFNGDQDISKIKAIFHKNS